MPVTLVVLILAAWVGAVAALVCVDRADRFLWIPVALAVAGALSSILPLAMYLETALVANGVLLTLFIVSLEALSIKHRRDVAIAKFRAR